MNKRAVGTAYEKAAGEYLKQQGYEILEYNFRCRNGEIDLIARDGAYLVFVEVKYRHGAGAGSPLEAVNVKKQRTISRTADYYCLTHGYGETTPCRFDVVAVLGEEIRLVRNAFDYRR
ncbi:MAG: YraN family protein [Roseburia sp.]